jgi:hypothetical protein
MTSQLAFEASFRYQEFGELVLLASVIEKKPFEEVGGRQRTLRSRQPES